MNMGFDEYDMWFSDKIGNHIRDFLTIAQEEGGCRFLYESSYFPKWKRDIEIYRACRDRLDRQRIKVSKLSDENYPLGLEDIFDPPFLLYYKGNLPPGELRCCSIVGSRKATSYGRNIAREIGKTLGRNGIGVISGLALGADSWAHRGALEGGGYTLAILGSGVDKCTPSSNSRLMEEIIESGGGVASEFLPGTPGYSANYPKRNRIISGMSEGIIVTEADERSGTSITARLALEQGRDVYAVPGNINSRLSSGTNRLIKEGAIPLITIEDILEELGIEKEGEKSRGYLLNGIGKEEEDIYRIVEKYGSVSVDALCMETGKRPEDVVGIVTVLEIKGVVFRSFGKISIAKSLT